MCWKTFLAHAVAVCLCSVALSSFAAEAQSLAKVYRIGWLSRIPLLSSRATLTRALNDLGYVEGRNLTIDVRQADGKDERLSDLAAELVALKPDVIVAVTTVATKAAQEATKTIPIVIVQVSDPVGSGFVASLARPGGNITGVTDFGIDLAPKYVELANTIAPGATRIGLLMSDNPLRPAMQKAMEDAATSRGFTLLPAMDRSDAELEQAFASLTKEKAGALIVFGGGPMGLQAIRIAELAAKAKLPTVYPDRYFVTKGGLLSYGPSYPQMYKMAATFVDRIFKGAKPSDLPVEQPTLFNMSINDKAVKALGITIPQSILINAEVIQ